MLKTPQKQTPGFRKCQTEWFIYIYFSFVHFYMTFNTPTVHLKRLK